MSPEEFDRVIDTNLRSAFLCTKAALKGMIQARWGRVISISSVSGIAGNPGQANYAASKAGLIGFSKSVAKEVGSRGITVNVVAPGFITTDMTGALSEDVKSGLAVVGQSGSFRRTRRNCGHRRLPCLRESLVPDGAGHSCRRWHSALIVPTSKGESGEHGPR